MGSRLGALKGAATHVGMSLEDYLARIDRGELWCTRCKGWHATQEFGSDAHRPCGKASSCRNSRHTGRPRGWHGKPNINPLTGKPGPAPGYKRKSHG